MHKHIFLRPENFDDFNLEYISINILNKIKFNENLLFTFNLIDAIFYRFFENKKGKRRQQLVLVVLSCEVNI